MNLTRMSEATTNPLYIHNRRYKHNEFLDEIVEQRVNLVELEIG